ncbi:ATP-binding domain-containing protein [Klebsiella grimontii]|uniref:ATP-binding domain-containing protein n=1 Tax=Klebsiella grimontii TaxID=2058152 RepID=UPI0015EA6D09|nr:ATP-binding domain-containing protein [Klebsiella grimontii]QLT07503.1 ATP-binding domain-containing protein [Klebsiella grimontii]
MDFPDYTCTNSPSIPLNLEQSKALTAINEWFCDSTCPVFALTGAYSTGKSKVLQALLKQMPKTITTQRYLAPNARIARLHVTGQIEEVTSIYSWLYSHHPQDIKEDKPWHPVSCQDHDVFKAPQESLLVIFDAHLLGNDFFASETALYGSGHILSDLLLLLKGETQDTLPQSLPKILLLGDPYQLRRGAKEKSLLECQIFQQNQIPFRTVELKSQDRDLESLNEQLDFQRELVGQLAAQKFIQLPISQQQMFRTITKGQQTAQIAEELISPGSECIYLCATNERAQAVNLGIRGKYLQARVPGLLVEGDRIEIYNKTFSFDHDGDALSGHMPLHAGQFARVTQAARGFFSKSITLKGRDKPTTVEFAHVTLQSNDTFSTVLYLPEFLISLKPELDTDKLLALRIWARVEADEQLKESKSSLEGMDKKSSEYKEAREDYQKKHSQLILNSKFTYAARLRYAWALTVHRAQSHQPFNRVILEASTAYDTDNPATDSYFRWLYTATTRTMHTLDILNYPTLNPLSKTEWHLSSLRTVPLVVKQRFHFAKNRLPTESELNRELPAGFNPQTPELFALLLAISDALYHSAWRISSIHQHPYKERYFLNNECGEAILDFDYNGKFEVTIGKCQGLSGNAQLEQELRQLLNTPVVWLDDNIRIAMHFMDWPLYFQTLFIA